jgi:hypothetical protein
VTWGRNNFGQATTPVNNHGITRIAAGGRHSLALKNDGSVLGWGSGADGQLTVPEPNAGFVDVAAGAIHSVGLKSDGSIVAWGNNSFGQLNVPAPNTGFIAIAAGDYHSVGLRSDGSIAAWGANGFGQTDVPVPNGAFVGIGCGYYHTLAVRQDGSVVTWGYNGTGQADVPAPNSHFVFVGGGTDHSFGLRDESSTVLVSGIITSDCGGGLFGVTVDLFDSFGAFHTTTSDALGNFELQVPFSDESNGGEISIVAPLGYVPVSPSGGEQLLTLDQSRYVEFELACGAALGAPRSIGYWRHNINVHLNARGNAQESSEDMSETYPERIYQHFFENQLQSIAIEGLTHLPDPSRPLDLECMARTFNVVRGSGVVERAKQHFMATLLNIASGKLLTSSVVTSDGGSVSEVLQYVTDLLLDGDESNEGTVLRLCEAVNSSETIGSGEVPIDDYHLIAYSPQSRTTTALSVLPNPAPMRGIQVVSFTTHVEGRVVLEIFDVRGGLVATPFRGDLPAGHQRIVWTGSGVSGRLLPPGVYFGRMTTPDRVERMTLVRSGE